MLSCLTCIAIKNDIYDIELLHMPTNTMIIHTQNHKIYWSQTKHYIALKL